MSSDTQQIRTYLRSLPTSGVYGHDLTHKLTSNQKNVQDNLEIK
jgi:hypothetical protein